MENPYKRRDKSIVKIFLAIAFYFLIFIIFLAIISNESLVGKNTNRLMAFSFFVTFLSIAGLMEIRIIFYSVADIVKKVKAKPLEKEKYLAVYQALDNVCISYGTKTPQLYVVDYKAPRCLAMGGYAQNPGILVTTGLLELLCGPELEAVFAHEVSHIISKEPEWKIFILALGKSVFTFLLGSRTKGSIFYGADAKIADTHMRNKEFLADAEAVLITHNTEVLASALEKIESVEKALSGHLDKSYILESANWYSGQNGALLRHRIEALRVNKNKAQNVY